MELKEEAWKLLQSIVPAFCLVEYINFDCGAPQERVLIRCVYPVWVSTVALVPKRNRSHAATHSCLQC